MLIERRQSVRFQSSFYIRYTSFDSSGEVSAMAKDVSMGGVKILLDKSQKVLPSSLVCLYFLLPKETLKINGEIVWEKEYPDRKEAGMRFTQIPDSYKEDIFNYVSKYYPQELNRCWWKT